MVETRFHSRQLPTGEAAIIPLPLRNRKGRDGRVPSGRSNGAGPDAADLRLADIPIREVVELIGIDLPDDQVEPLLERGLMPGCQLCPIRHSPFGDPIVSVDGSLLALRREMAGCLCVRRTETDAG